MHAAAFVQRLLVVGQVVVEEARVVAHVGSLGMSRRSSRRRTSSRTVAPSLLRVPGLSIQPITGFRRARAPVAHPSGPACRRAGAGDAGAQLAAPGQLGALDFALRGHGGVAAFGVAHQVELAVVGHAGVAAPALRGVSMSSTARAVASACR